MSEQIEKEYTRILEETREGGEVDTRTSGDERRENPRLKISGVDFSIDAAPQISVLNLSISGIAFHSNHPLAPGDWIAVTLGPGLSAEAEVIACEMEETSPDADFADSQFRVQCKIPRTDHGMRLLVTARKRGSGKWD